MPEKMFENRVQYFDDGDDETSLREDKKSEQISNLCSWHFAECVSFFLFASVCLSIHSPWSFFFFFYFSFFPFPLNVIAQLIISFSKKKERKRVDKFKSVRLLPIYVFKLSFVLQIEFGRRSSEYLVFSSWNRTMRPHFICCCMA